MKNKSGSPSNPPGSRESVGKSGVRPRIAIEFLLGRPWSELQPGAADAMEVSAAASGSLISVPICEASGDDAPGAQAIQDVSKTEEL